ncbi:hypothetical protein AUP68_08118 [Ilyonectria robusta]
MLIAVVRVERTHDEGDFMTRHDCGVDVVDRSASQATRSGGDNQTAHDHDARRMLFEAHDQPMPLPLLNPGDRSLAPGVHALYQSTTFGASIDYSRRPPPEPGLEASLENPTRLGALP